MAGITGRHDVGGITDDAPIDVSSGSKKYKLWEVQTHSLVSLLSKKGLLTVDEVEDAVQFSPPLWAFRCPTVAAEKRPRGTAQPCVREDELL